MSVNAKDKEIHVSGFKHISEHEIDYKYSKARVVVPSNSHSCVGLNSVEINKQKFSVRLVSEGYLVKYLIEDLPIKSIYDVRLKFKKD